MGAASWRTNEVGVLKQTSCGYPRKSEGCGIDLGRSDQQRRMTVGLDARAVPKVVALASG